MAYKAITSWEQRVIHAGVVVGAGTVYTGWIIPANTRINRVRAIMVPTAATEAFLRIAAGDEFTTPTTTSFSALRRQFVAWPFTITGITGDFQLPQEGVIHEYELDYVTRSQEVVVAEFKPISNPASLTLVLDAGTPRYRR
jgi:hypothetical protein